jgi:protein gp37
MGEFSKIEWCDATFNPWIGCQHVSPGCEYCYAEDLNTRWHYTAGGEWGPHAERHRTSASTWNGPRVWQRGAAAFCAKHGRRRRVFCASLSDWLDNQAPKEWRYDLCRLIEQTPDLDWLLLTKRIENFKKLVPENWKNGPPANVWLGATMESQEYYQKRMPILASIPAVVRFVSYEPAIGPLGQIVTGSVGNFVVPDWIIIGGESGPQARTMNPQWARDVVRQCKEHRCVAPFLKQWGTYASNPLVQERGMTIEEAKRLDREGKGGGLLDGRLYREFPKCGKTAAQGLFAGPLHP